MRLEKNILQIKTFKEADIQKDFWSSKSYTERLQAGVLITKIAYGLVGKPEPKMDKTSFEIRFRNG